MNSRWAIDPFSYHMMIVGDQGKAILYDVTMGAKLKKRKVTGCNRYLSDEVVEKRAVHTKRVPVYVPEIDSAGEPVKWRIVKSWFTAHNLSKTEPHFVNNVKYSKAMNIFLTSTNFGEVKLWDSKSC